nr:uncharacterized protein LOC111517618 [Leptinotarsa decemlineata]
MHALGAACRASLDSADVTSDAYESLEKREPETSIREINISGTDDNVVDAYNFCAEKFVEQLLTEGSNITCDGTSESFNGNKDLPPYYDEIMFKKGQAFFHKHIFGLFLSKLLGLLALLSLPSLRILMMTRKSSTPMTAYKRYMGTIFHMCVWYDSDFQPGSKLWKSIANVRNMHNAASKRSNLCFKTRITQMDMALTQFGFMGLGLIRSKMLGIHYATDDEWKGFLHLWRVIGYLVGTEDRFNLCRESVQETKEICELLARKVFIPRMAKTGPDFDLMSSALIDGMRAMNPVLHQEGFLRYLHMVLRNNPDPEITDEQLKPLSKIARARLNLILNVTWALQYTIVRVLLKYCQIWTLWLMRVCPFLAYSRFGFENSHVRI